MPWSEKRKTKDGKIHYRIRDRIDGEIKTVVKYAGQWADLADIRLIEYKKQKAVGGSNLAPLARLRIEEMCDTNLRLHAKNLKDGLDPSYNSSYYNLKLRMERFKLAWAGRYADEINRLTVRDFLLQFKTVGTRLRWLGYIGRMFRNFEIWQEEGNILPRNYQLPRINPATACRRDMKASEKRELPDTRVLSLEEWRRFSSCLSKNAKAICEIALRRCLRITDIKHITHLSVDQGHIKGLQQKTGDPFRIPIVSDHPSRYNFKNFAGEFEKAQIKSGLHYPADHPLHFSVKDLRRTGATWAYRQTKDLAAIQKLLGHRNISTTQRYLNIDSVDVQKVTKAIDILARSKGPPEEHFQ